MTIKEFANRAGMEYQDVCNAVFASDIHQRGKHVDYDFQGLRRVILKFLDRQEARLMKKQEAVQTAIKRIHDMRE